ncbi:hypothetical protein CFP56_021031 [Quercus suber]|uniref:Uncharacterized protein n=1 Tax=Quercus suber TaxID=58331 RepID=A0AAW0KFI5_QUESU
MTAYPPCQAIDIVVEAPCFNIEGSGVPNIRCHEGTCLTTSASKEYIKGAPSSSTAPAASARSPSKARASPA